MQHLLNKDVGKERMTRDEADAAWDRVKLVKGDGSGSGNGGEEVASDTDLVIEASLPFSFPSKRWMKAIPEIPDLKLALFKRLGALLPPTAILGSNTSSISLTKLAASAGSMGGDVGEGSAARVIGIHYFNPVPVMKLVEIIPGLQTSQETIDRATSFGKACKKGAPPFSTSILVIHFPIFPRDGMGSDKERVEVTTSKDSPGFIANAILMPMINEAIMLLEKGTASPTDIDLTFTLGLAHPLGPLALADLIGLDTCLHIQRVLMHETGDSKYRPAGLLVRMVDAGWVGRKGGRGFYEY
ncbi:hypothetical protein B9479_000450 [Cryptococcus floricola]|uniref:3-hydroxybutyryl-CoA dehydrogenase n=1 Tax=Cryptococcus floricola TaxID=2591691 RepID=A0A5D3B8S8_9TREE|nr:hypothetical protein B9479_000450 [Cryptococcus floricola]